jgi:hypothetical protein
LEEDIVKGSASPEDQLDFWLNIMSAVGSLEGYGGFSEGMLDAVGKLEEHLRKIKDGVIRVGGIRGGSTEDEKLERTGNQSEAKQVLQNIANASSDNFKRFNARAEDLLAPEESNFSSEAGVLGGTGAQIATLAKMLDLMSLFSTLGCSLPNTGTQTRGSKADETNHLSTLVGNSQLSSEKLLEVASSLKVSSPTTTKKQSKPKYHP